MAKLISADGNDGQAAPPARGSTAKRLLWFVALWGASVLALTAVSQLIRWAIMP